MLILHILEVRTSVCLRTWFYNVRFYNVQVSFMTNSSVIFNIQSVGSNKLSPDNQSVRLFYICDNILIRSFWHHTKTSDAIYWHDPTCSDVTLWLDSRFPFPMPGGSVEAAVLEKGAHHKTQTMQATGSRLIIILAYQKCNIF